MFMRKDDQIKDSIQTLKDLIKHLLGRKVEAASSLPGKRTSARENWIHTALFSQRNVRPGLEMVRGLLRTIIHVEEARDGRRRNPNRAAEELLGQLLTELLEEAEEEEEEEWP